MAALKGLGKSAAAAKDTGTSGAGRAVRGEKQEDQDIFRRNETEAGESHRPCFNDPEIPRSR